MIQKYYDLLTKIENIVDGLMIVDENCVIQYNKQFTPSGVKLDERESIGRTPMEVYPNLSPGESTCYRAVVYGETTTNKVQRLVHRTGEMTILDTTFPVLENGRIIGAVSTARYLDQASARDFLDLSHMTTARTKDLYDLGDIVGGSQETLLLKFRITKVAATASSVFIHGETGTGKELVAQSIHSASPRRSACFISQNCAAIPQTLLESIFFGTTRGSYTGAENRPGIFELADGGTIFLDELTSMDLGMQAKLLKAIEEKKITRLGGAEARRVDVRILSATNEPPARCLQEQRMRADLFYRLSAVQIHVPPLRERTCDLPDLAAHFTRLFSRELGKPINGVSPAVMRAFEAYPWPGNIREFRNVLECACNFAAGDTVQMEDLPDTFQGAAPDRSVPATAGRGSLREEMDRFEQALLADRLRETHSLTDLAGQLRISKQTLNYKLRKHGLRAGSSS